MCESRIKGERPKLEQEQLSLEVGMGMRIPICKMKFPMEGQQDGVTLQEFVKRLVTENMAHFDIIPAGDKWRFFVLLDLQEQWAALYLIQGNITQNHDTLLQLMRQQLQSQDEYLRKWENSQRSMILSPSEPIQNIRGVFLSAGYIVNEGGTLRINIGAESLTSPRNLGDDMLAASLSPWAQ